MSNENEYKDFNYFHIIKPFYHFIAPDLPPSSQLLFLAIVFKFNECFWAGSVRITTAELSKLTGIHYNSIPRSRQTLLQYRFEDDPIIVCTDPRQNSVPFYTINKKLFLELYNRIPKKQNDSIIETGMEDYVVDLEKEISQNKFVYVISYDNYVKIGKTSNVQKRFNSLKGMSNIKIELLWYATETESINEQLLHDIFKQYRSHNEYFEYSDEIKEFIESMKDAPLSNPMNEEKK